MELRELKKVKSLREWFAKRKEMGQDVFKLYSDEEQKALILTTVLDEFFDKNYCELVESEKIGDISVFVPLVNKLYDKEFEQSSDTHKADVLAEFIFAMSDYIGIKHPNVYFDFKNKGEYQIIPTNRGKQKDLTLDYGFSTYNNDLCVSIFTNKFFKDVYKNRFNADLFRENIIASYILTIRHECEHLLQFAKIKEFGNPELTNEEIVLLFCLLYMDNAIFNYKVSNDCDMSGCFGLLYLAEFFEYEARRSEFEFITNLLNCKGLSNEARVGLNQFLFEEVLDNSRPFRNFVPPMSEFITKRMDLKKHEFEKIFGTNPMGQRILNLYSYIDKDKITEKIGYEELDVIRKENEFYGINCMLNSRYKEREDESEQIINDVIRGQDIATQIAPTDEMQTNDKVFKASKIKNDIEQGRE